MSDTWRQLGSFLYPVTDRLQPVSFDVKLQGSIAVALMAEATRSGNKPETIIAEAVRSYLGDAA